MPRFLLHVLAGNLGAGIFYSAMPMFLAMGLNALWPFGLDSLTATNQIKVFALGCVAVLFPMTAISVVRSGRRMFFAANDGRPALFGRAGTGLRAERLYKTRSLVALFTALVAAVVAAGLAAYSAKQADSSLAVAVLSSCLVTVAAALAAIELNDLRRTVRITLYACDA